MDYLEEFDKLKSKVLKYTLYKKRSEAEIKRKFAEFSSEMLDNVIEELKENGYIDDNIYIEKTVKEYQRLKNLSIRELEYKLLSKGINKKDIENYIYNNKEELFEYEINSAKKLFFKKQTYMEKD